tara:strand:+ start:93 stop:713 length:621 start_codon:yes stop_codon:yes gene_type:complete
VSSDKLNVNHRNYWDSRYKNGNHSWNIGKPTPIFENWSNSISNKSKINICIPGCGMGYDALYLASEGFNVYAFDFSIKAIEYLRSQASKKNIKLNVFCEDFFHINPKYFGYFDYILEYTFYCAIKPNRRLEYINLCHKLLKSRGIFIGIMLPIVKKDSIKGPPFYVSKNELIDNFKDKFDINKISKSSLSIKQRMDIELYAEYQKK